MYAKRSCLSETSRRSGSRSGFTLVEIIIAVAIVAIMAATITPLAFKEMMRVREESTLIELDSINESLQSFYQDTGRFPTEAEGLAALVQDPGVTGWQGPYLGGDGHDSIEAATVDAFGENYVYDLTPNMVPAVAADVMIISGGSDQTITTGSLNSAWQTANAENDLYYLVTVGPLNREKNQVCETKMEKIAEAARSFYQDNAAFPVSINQLVGTYLDTGFAGQNGQDSWQRPFLLAVVSGGAVADQLLISSSGPDRINDNGANDDLLLTVSSIPPGRKTTLWKLDIVQSSLNANVAYVPTGNWSNDRAALGLDVAFENDGWGNQFAVNIGSRVVYSVGPDGNGVMRTDNLPAGVGP